MRLKWTIEYLDVAPIAPITSSSFTNDQVIVYQGIYSVPSYVIWYARPYPDKPRQFRLSTLFNLTLHTVDKDAPLIQTYKIESVVYDVGKKMWRIFAIAAIWYMVSQLNKIEYFEYPEETNGIEIIKDVLASGLPNFKVNYDKQELEKFSILKYRYISFDKQTTILDIISKVCNENNWEWYLAHDMLHVSKSLYLKGVHAQLVAKEAEHIKDAVSWIFRTRTLDARGAEPMTIFENSRIIWVKYNLGENIGDMMTVMCQLNTGRIGSDYPYAYITQETFSRTLTGVSKQLADMRMYKSYAQMPVIAGRIFGKVTDTNLYQTPKFSGDMIKTTKNWETRKYFNQNDYSSPDASKPILYAEKPRITTPYAGDNVGMLFPQEENQHRLLFSPNGERDMPLVGPAFFAEDETPPVREGEKDFRLQLPGAVIYIKEDGTIIIEQSNDGAAVPDGSNASIKIASDGTISINGLKTLLEGGGYTLSHSDHVHGYNHLHPTGNMGIPIPQVQHIGIGEDTDAHLAIQGTTNTEGD